MLKADSFLNHQIDIAPMGEIGRELKRRFCNKTVSRVPSITDAMDAQIGTITFREQTVFPAAMQYQNAKEPSVQMAPLFYDLRIVRIFLTAKAAKGISTKR